MQTQLYKESQADKYLIKGIADSLADEMARKMYYKLMMLKFLPEIKGIESGKIIPIKGKAMHKFFDELKA